MRGSTLEGTVNLVNDTLYKLIIKAYSHNGGDGIKININNRIDLYYAGGGAGAYLDSRIGLGGVFGRFCAWRTRWRRR